MPRWFESTHSHHFCLYIQRVAAGRLGACRFPWPGRRVLWRRRNARLAIPEFCTRATATDIEHAAPRVADRAGNDRAVARHPAVVEPPTDLDSIETLANRKALTEPGGPAS